MNTTDKIKQLEAELANKSAEALALKSKLEAERNTNAVYTQDIAAIRAAVYQLLRILKIDVNNPPQNIKKHLAKALPKILGSKLMSSFGIGDDDDELDFSFLEKILPILKKYK